MTESPTLSTTHGIALDQRGGDVWAWEKWLAGTCAGLPAGTEIALLVNGEAVPAERDDDTFAATVRLNPGANEVVAVATLLDGGQVVSEPVTHTVRLVPRPVARIQVNVSGDAVTLIGAISEPSELDGAPIVSWRWSERLGNPETLIPPDVAGAGGASLTVPAPAADGEYSVSLEVTDAAGRTDTGTACVVVENGVARAMDPVAEVAGWVESAVVYGMVVRNFTSDGFRGVTERMGELADLGVAAIWLAPVTGTPPGDFGYAVTDYFGVREEYGTLDDLRALVDAAHARDIRVLMDFVPNHTSHLHPYSVDAAEHGTASQYADWFDRGEDGEPTFYFNWEHLPNLNLDNPEVRRFMTEAFAFWMRECGIDGFRVDVAWGIKERRPDYWLEWSAELNRIAPDSLLIAEASARDPFYVRNGFDAAYDWTDELGVWAWGEVFAGDRPIPKAMRDALTSGGAGYDSDALTLRFLNNNDTGPRFITTHGLDRYRVAMAMLLTLPGIPCVYTGDEVAAEYLPYDSEGEIDWSDPHDTRAFVTRLIRLRREHPALHAREWEAIEIEPAEHLFGYLRGTGPDAIAVLLNFSTEDIAATVPMLEGFDGSGALIDLWSGERIPAGGSGTLAIPMPAWGFRLLKGVAP